MAESDLWARAWRGATYDFLPPPEYDICFMPTSGG